MRAHVIIVIASSKETQGSSVATWTPAAIIAGSALIFTVMSFWWLNAHRGKLKSFEPFSFSAVLNPGIFRLRFPLVFYNRGAVPIIIQDLRIRFLDEPNAPPLSWTTTRSHIKPETDDSHAFPAVFSVAGRTALQTFQEFGASPPGFILHAKDYRVRLEAKFGHRKKWSNILTFTFWAWNISDPEHYITYANSPGDISKEQRQDVETGLRFAQIGSPQGSADNSSDNSPE